MPLCCKRDGTFLSGIRHQDSAGSRRATSRTRRCALPLQASPSSIREVSHLPRGPGERSLNPDFRVGHCKGLLLAHPERAFTQLNGDPLGPVASRLIPVGSHPHVGAAAPTRRAVGLTADRPLRLLPSSVTLPTPPLPTRLRRTKSFPTSCISTFSECPGDQPEPHQTKEIDRPHRGPPCD